MDPRIKTLAKNLVGHSIAVKPGEKVLIENIGLEASIVTALVNAVYDAGGIPLVTLKDNTVNRALQMRSTEEQIKLQAKFEAQRMQEMDCYIGLRSGNNTAELSDVSITGKDLYQKYMWKAVHGEIRVPKTRWVVLRYPTPSMAQLANMSLEAFEDYYFNVCNLDYGKMAKAMEPLTALMNRTDKVRLVARGTDLTLSIKGMQAGPCAGNANIPDGEVCISPVLDSVNGVITYNTPTLNQGITFENVHFEIKNGKIVEATSNHTADLNRILDTDEGARYFGEFAIGLNPYINVPMKDTLFDEKIAGSIHFTPGGAYGDGDKENRSAIHWDIVLIQTPEYGGGEIWFDDVLIRKDGLFVLPELLPLNPENLK